MLLSAAPSGLADSCIPSGGSATLHPRLCSYAASRLRIHQQVPKGWQSIKPHTKSTKFTKFLSREAAQDYRRGWSAAEPPAQTKQKNKPRRGGRIQTGVEHSGTPGRQNMLLMHSCTWTRHAYLGFWIPRNSVQFAVCRLQLSRCVHNCTPQTLRGRDARVPTVHSGGGHCYQKLHTANCTLQIPRGRDARVPTVHSGGGHCYQKLQTANYCGGVCGTVNFLKTRRGYGRMRISFYGDGR